MTQIACVRVATRRARIQTGAGKLDLCVAAAALTSGGPATPKTPPSHIGSARVANEFRFLRRVRVEMTIKRRRDHQRAGDTPRKISHARTLFEDVNFQFPPDNTPPRADETHFYCPSTKDRFLWDIRGALGKS
jgi:hypothetical protein